MSKLPGGWRNATLDEIAIKDGRGLVDGPFGSNLPASEYVSQGIPVIRGSNLSMGLSRFVDAEFVYVSEETARRLERSLCKAEDIVFTKKGTLGQTGIIPRKHKYDKFLLSSNQMKLTVDPELADALYVYYFVSSPMSIEKLLRDAEATGVPKTNLAYLRSFSIFLPPLSEQREIASILGSLDDKIELNRRMNETLEATARAIFQSWFVDFDPVRAKAEGRQSEGMDAETAALFPDSFEESELGLIPRGWRVGTLGEIVENYDSRRVPLSGAQRQNRKGSYAYYGAASVMDFVDNYLFDGVYLLMAEDGSVADRKGYPTLQYVWGKFWVNNHAHVIRGKDSISTEFLYLLLQGTRITPYITGAVQPKLNQANMNRIPCIIAPADVNQRFTELITSYFAQKRALSDQSKTLIALRDVLLPKLISGAIRVG